MKDRIARGTPKGYTLWKREVRVRRVSGDRNPLRIKPLKSWKGGLGHGPRPPPCLARREEGTREGGQGALPRD